MKNLKCFFGKHKREEVRVISEDTKELKCTRCPDRFALNVNTGDIKTMTPKMFAEHDIRAAEYEERFCKNKAS